ncbi:intersectin-2 isoform X5 [Athalia rosae]|uniref:intersectin-2 isoform X5 n=1 Tax=Athalia rosae TaxID=37344 RepID=UPI002033A0C3|nr:intersectin-2 isoform X5 [Athalia rosae]
MIFLRRTDQREMAAAAALGVDPWVIQPRERARYQEQFNSLKPVNGIVTGDQVKGFLLQSQLPPPILGKIWGLSDTDADGKMDLNEFSIACKLINLKLRGFEIPNALPPSLIRSLKVIPNDGDMVNLVNGGNINGVTTAQPLGLGSVPGGMMQPLTGLNGSASQPMQPLPPMSMPMASHQNKPSVAPGTHITSYATSKPPARPAPPSMAPLLDLSFDSAPPLTPMRSAHLFLPGTVPLMRGPPPKPAPPSFPNSPVNVGMSPTVAPIIPPIQQVQSMTTAAPMGIPSVAPIAPLNTNPAPIAAFGMGGVMPIQPAMLPPTMAPLPPMSTGIPIANIPPASVQPLIGNVPVAPIVAPSVNGNHTPVSTSSPMSTTTRPPSIDRVGSMDSQHSQHSIGSPQVEWAVPHQTKLKYTQLFNTWDRTRSGFLSGPQARNIMVQTQLPQAILAQVWALSDMDVDGRLGCEEFVLAMHLCDMAKAGEKIPTTLPIHLIPPAFRRQRQGSITSQGIVENIDPSAGMPQTSFENKRKENFEKGQAELERRRKTLLEIQRKEQEERERKEREEAEKQEKIRLEQERRRQAEIEKQMLRQKEIEQEKEEQRKRAQEQRDSARKEMERQRQLEWEKQKSQELQAQRQKEQDILLKLKAKNQGLTIELGTLNEKVKELSQKICDTRFGVSGVKTTIDGMRSTRDTQLQEMSALKNKLREQNQRLLSLSQEKARIEAKNKLNNAQDIAGQEAVKMAFANKQITLKQMKDKIADLQQQINEKMKDIENNNSQLDDIKKQMKNLVTECGQLYHNFEDKKSKVNELRAGSGTGEFASSAWGDSAWGDSGTVNTDSWPVDNTSTSHATITGDSTGAVKYRALYEFVARNQDEISFQPGDIIMVPPVQNAEPGWMAGEIRGHTGWFPESYVEPVEVDTVISNSDTFVQQDSIEKRTLEGIAEVPENVSDAGSLGGEGPAVDPIIPTLGLGSVCNLQATALYQYRPIIQQHLSFNKGDTINVTEQQENWWYGELNGAEGWFPKSYIKTITPTRTDVSLSTGTLDEYYIALYPYASTETGDLSFNQGEIMMVTKKEGDWWTGVIGDRVGIFPSNYVEKCDNPDQTAIAPANIPEVNSSTPIVEAILPTNVNEKPVEQAVTITSNSAQGTPLQEKTKEELEEERAEAEDRAELPDFAAMSAQQSEDFGSDTDSKPSTPQYPKARGKKPEIGQVIAPYQATSPEQLNLHRGQLIMIRKKTETGWWEGELQARGQKRQIGWFPASYVKLLGSSSNRSTPVSHRYQDSPTDPNIERVMALYPYQALNEDELSFEKGDVITVLAKEDAAWWRGEMNGVSGVFPSNYVSPMSGDMIREVMLGLLDETERKRQEHIKELIATEQAYIEDMSLVHEVFEKPLLQSMVLTVDEVEKIFVNWRDIIVCNDNFLRTLRIRRDNSDGGIIRMIGDILCENIPRMSAYVRFCSCQLSAATYLQQLTEKSSEFVEVALQCQQDPRTKGMPLSSFLIKPMQRITKYPLIINKILEYTPISHPDRQYLQEALAKAEEFCIQVNEGVREKENSDRLEWLQKHVSCDGLEEQLIFNSLTNSLEPRKFLHHGILHKAKSGKGLVGFLMNDFILFAQPTKSLPSGQQFSFERNANQKFKLYKKPTFLSELSVLTESEVNGNDTSDNSRTIRLKDSKRITVLLAPSASECTLWTKRIREARKAFIENERNHLQRQRSKQAQFAACGRILVTVLEGSSIKTLSGKYNTFCKVAMGSQEERTQVVTGTNCPLWDTSMQFQVKDLHEDTLCITVFDKGYYSPDEFLGRAEVRVSDIIRDSRDSCGPIQKRIKLHEVETGDVILKLDLRLFNNYA